MTATGRSPRSSRRCRSFPQPFPPSDDRFDRAAQASGHLIVWELSQQCIGCWSPVMAMGLDSQMVSSGAHVGDRPPQPAGQRHIRGRAQQRILLGLPGPWTNEFFHAERQNAKPAAAMPHRPLADSQEHRNLRLRTLAQQFVVGGRPPVLLRIGDANAKGGTARCHTFHASLQPSRQPTVRHRTQQFLFRPTPRLAVWVKRRDAELAATLGYRLP